MERARIEELAAVYRDGLLDDTLPFWTRHSVDRDRGGFLFCLDRDGTVVDTDKGVWQHARFTWLLATLYREVEPRAEWYELAEHGIRFLRRHAFADDGRMYFQVTRDGRPLRRRRYVFTEAFGAIAFGAWAAISGDQEAAETARRLFALVLAHEATPGLTDPKVDPDTRPTRGLALPMIVLGTARVLRDALGDATAAAEVDRAIARVEAFYDREREVVYELLAADGRALDHFDGRTLNPGHAIEAAWFVLAEARQRGGDARLEELGCAMLDCMWRRGWDSEHGGLLYFVDVGGGPVAEYWHDMKFWWPHAEAILATLFAHLATGEERYAAWHGEVHRWAHAHFPDPEHGEWFGYLHRDGRLSVPLKGNLWKGPFHVPRMQLVAWRLLASELERPGGSGSRS
ncbi:MAG: AGE family epimerase/isomerase [Planctomycetota bacterium]